MNKRIKDDEAANKLNPLRARAIRNIEAKLQVLQNWIDAKCLPLTRTHAGQIVRDDDGETVLDYYPDDILGFAKWDGTQNCPDVQREINDLLAMNGFEPMRSFSRSTLDQTYHEELRLRVDTTLKTIVSLANQQRKASNKANEIRSLLREIAFYEDLIRQQSSEIVLYRSKLSALEGEARKDKKIANERNHEYERIIDDLRRRNAELTTTISQLTPIRIHRTNEETNNNQ